MSQPLRGEVWDVQFPNIGLHPAVVLSINLWTGKLDRAMVVLITGTEGPHVTHVPMTINVGLTRYVQSYANITDLHSVSLGRFRRRRGLLQPVEMAEVEDRVAVYLGLTLV